MTPFKILIVEDEILIADNIERYLSRKGHIVVGIAISYEEAIQLYVQEKPDITLLDIRLNGSKSGIDVAHFIQQQAQPTPFIFLTSQMDLKNIEAAKKTFPEGYLSKPIQKDSLYATIEIALHKYRLKKNAVPTVVLYDGIKKILTPIQDILFLEAEHVYVKVHLQNGDCILQRGTLKDLMEELLPEQFLQTHRSFVVNLQYVQRWDSQQLYVMDNIIPMSRARRKEILLRLEEVNL